MSKEKDSNCGCGHGHHHEDDHDCQCHSHEDVEMIHLTLNDGKELICEVLGVFEIEDKEYIALLPNDDENVYLYGYKETDEGPVLSQIESDEEYEAVSKTFLSLCE